MEFVGKDDVQFGIAYLPSRWARRGCFIYSFCMLLSDGRWM